MVLASVSSSVVLDCSSALSELIWQSPVLVCLLDEAALDEIVRHLDDGGSDWSRLDAEHLPHPAVVELRLVIDWHRYLVGGRVVALRPELVIQHL